jgi:hypothetical protein
MEVLVDSACISCWCCCLQDAFKLAVFGSVQGAPEKQISGGTKRKTEDPDAKVGGGVEG